MSAMSVEEEYVLEPGPLHGSSSQFVGL